MKHTKGEWIAKESEVYSQETGKTIARCDIGGRDEETEANARLTAAAPKVIRKLNDLLGVLEEQLTEDAKENESIIEAIQDCESVIYEATQP